MRTDWNTPPQMNVGPRMAAARKVGISRRSLRPSRPGTTVHETARRGAEPRPAAVAEEHVGSSVEMGRAAEQARAVHSGRFASYTRADLLRLAGVDPEQVEDLDQSMAELGFAHLGDLHSSRTGSAVFRVYGQPESSVYAILLKGGPRGGYEPELFTAFEDGASLTTSVTCRSGMSQDRKRKTLRFGAEGTVAERFAAHIEKVWELSQVHGGARMAEPTLAAFAVTLDELLLRVQA